MQTYGQRQKNSYSVSPHLSSLWPFLGQLWCPYFIELAGKFLREWKIPLYQNGQVSWWYVHFSENLIETRQVFARILPTWFPASWSVLLLISLPGKPQDPHLSPSLLLLLQPRLPEHWGSRRTVPEPGLPYFWFLSSPEVLEILLPGTPWAVWLSKWWTAEALRQSPKNIWEKFLMKCNLKSFQN